MCAFFRLWALVGKSKNFSVSHCSAGLQKYSAFFSLSTSHSRIIFVSSGSNESSGTGGCHMCATAFTADTIIHSTSTLFLTQADWVSTSHTKYEKKAHTLYADWNGSRNLNGEEWREEKKSYRFLFRWLVGSEYFLVGRLLYSWPKPECVSDIMCVALFFFLFHSSI